MSAIPETIPLPLPPIRLVTEADLPPPRPSWLYRRFRDLGVLDMSNTQPHQPGFYVNWTTLSALVVIVGAIAGLWWFTWQQGQAIGYEKGKSDAEKIEMQRQIDAAGKAADKAKDIALGAQSDQAPQPKEKKK